MTKIEWVDVPGWPEFQVTKDGNIRKSNEKPATLKRNRNGYIYVTRREQGINRILFVHRAVLFAFVGQPREKEETRHLNGIKEDNRLENLA